MSDNTEKTEKIGKPTLPEHVRLRFCPSPTGIPHVGMIHTALYNWAEARHAGGTLIFRMEDTDSKRDTQESLDMIIEALHWMGIDWDEGIGKGPDEMYFQSKRADVYAKVAQQLLDAGYAYESYSTAEEIAARNKAAGRPETFGYDGYDRTLSEEEKEKFRAEGRKPALRLKMPDEDITWNDLVRGEITFKAGSVPDYVIVRPNGEALYTLTNPIDDAITEVNVVLRGEDLLPSTPRQIVLYRYLIELGIAKQTPLFGHLPYVMGEGNKKLSKRDPQSNLFLLRDQGFIREGLLNYLALLGWSFSATEDVFSMEQFTDAFDVRDVKSNPAHFDLKKAIAINAAHIRMLEPEDFLRRSVPYLFKDGAVSADNWDALTDREKTILTQSAPLVQTRVRLLSEVTNMVAPLLSTDEYIAPADDAKKQLKDDSAEVLDKAIAALSTLSDDEWKTDKIHELLSEELVEKAGYKPRNAFGPVRVAMSGHRVSPPLFESMEIIGKTISMARLANLRANL
ncbi:MAG: glutamate--tRNA ligase [Aeriscardovia sp.]|nr:glutamate--tRNA ligase [Aeriscardovia sp.]